MNMDICHNVSLSTLDDLFPPHNMEVDIGIEWLSVFVEECFSSKPTCVFEPSSTLQIQTTTTNKNPSNTIQKPQQNKSYLLNFVVPGKPRSKRKRLSSPRTKIWSHSHPPLLKQTYWLAESELVNPNLKVESKVSTITHRDSSVYQKDRKNKNDGYDDEKEDVGNARRCSHCLSQRTPQWRAGPLGPKTLCNACGVSYKSGRLLPEYRPAKSPTFVNDLHSNSHKKVLQMRMQSN